MHGTIKVHVVKYANRPNLEMRYLDPQTGKQVAKSAKTSRRRDAERTAAKWEAELREGRYHRQSRMTWAEFRERYEEEKLATLSPKTLAAGKPLRTTWSASSRPSTWRRSIRTC